MRRPNKRTQPTAPLRRVWATGSALQRSPLYLCACLLTLWSAQVVAQGVGAEDRAKRLYRMVVSLDGQGNPVLPVSVYGGATMVRVRGRGGLTILGASDGLIRVKLKERDTLEVTASSIQRGKKNYWVTVARAPSNDMMALREALKRWRANGHKVRLRSVGATYAIKGRVLDTRATVLCLDAPFESLALARARATELARKHRQQVLVHVELATPPKATVKGHVERSVELESDEGLWLEAPSGMLEVQVEGSRGRRSMVLPGRVYIAPDELGALAVVNEARIETLLQGVVAAEIFASAPMAALRAQAVAARTDLLAKVGLRHRTDPFSICSEVHCQAYRGAKKIPAKIIKAVRDTRGQVLTGANGRLVDTFYHAVSGGHTEHNDNAWKMSPHPNLRGVPDMQPGAPSPLKEGPSEEAVAKLLNGPDRSYAAASGKNKRALRWTAKRTAKEIAPFLEKVGVREPLVAVNVLKRGVSGRAIEIAMTELGGRVVKLWGELRIRRAFRSLRSSLFLVTPGPKDARGAPQWWIFRGAGYGHGVGLDQTGAYGRAKLGQSYREILSAYYKGARLETLY